MRLAAPHPDRDIDARTFINGPDDFRNINDVVWDCTSHGGAEALTGDEFDQLRELI